MLAKTHDNEEIIERVAVLDIGKAELMCCVRVPDEDHLGRRLQDVDTSSRQSSSGQLYLDTMDMSGAVRQLGTSLSTD